MKALVFDKSKFDWESSRGFELINIPEPVLDLTASFGFAKLLIVNLTAFSRLALGRQFLF